MRFVLMAIAALTLVSCTHGNCRALEKKQKNKPSAEVTAMTNPSTPLQKVKIAKPDGSLQCGQGSPLSVADMQKQLKDIKIYSSENKNDGMMRIQVCGSPTGNFNVYEIDRKDLDAALKAGFKEWTAE